MQPSKYALKAGVLLQAFSDASRVMTNKNITDELAEWHLKHNPGCVVYFAVMPGKADVPDEIRNRPSVSGPTIIVPPEKEIPKIANDFIAAVIPPVEIIPPVTEQPLKAAEEKKIEPAKQPILKKKVAATKRKK